MMPTHMLELGCRALAPTSSLGHRLADLEAEAAVLALLAVLGRRRPSRAAEAAKLE